MKLKPTKYIWVDGKFVQWKNAKIHLITHTFHYGAGAFEGVRFYDTPKGSAVFRLADHTKRFFYSAKAVGIKMPYTQKQINETIVQLLKKKYSYDDLFLYSNSPQKHC
jgi:branched-chain amino acid aminotransferase